MLGAGMGTQMLSLLLAVQHGVDRSRLGLATSLNQFSRSIGAAVGVAAMGAIIARGLAGMALPGGAEAALASGAMALSGPMRDQFRRCVASRVPCRSRRLGRGSHGDAVPAAGALLEGVPAAAGEQLIEAEMTNLQPDDEPIAINE